MALADGNLSETFAAYLTEMSSEELTGPLSELIVQIGGPPDHIGGHFTPPDRSCVFSAIGRLKTLNADLARGLSLDQPTELLKILKELRRLIESVRSSLAAAQFKKEEVEREMPVLELPPLGSVADEAFIQHRNEQEGAKLARLSEQQYVENHINLLDFLNHAEPVLAAFLNSLLRVEVSNV